MMMRATLAALTVPLIGCLDQPTKIDLLSPSGQVIFDSPRDATQIHLSVLDQDGKEMLNPDIYWSSSNPKVATVSRTGRVIPHQNGHAVISARASYVEKDLPIVVHLASALRPTASALALEVGDVARIGGELLDNDGARMSGTFTWKSRDPGVATVDQMGEITAQKPGTTMIDVSFKHLTATILVEVSTMNAS